jgi:hypothetical protein
MTGGYDRVLNALDELDVSFMELDRIVVDADTYDDLQQRIDGGNISNYSTVSAPAIRVTMGDEYLLYVDEHGQEKKVEL